MSEPAPTLECQRCGFTAELPVAVDDCCEHIRAAEAMAEDMPKLAREFNRRKAR